MEAAEGRKVWELCQRGCSVFAAVEWDKFYDYYTDIIMLLPRFGVKSFSLRRGLGIIIKQIN